MMSWYTGRKKTAEMERKTRSRPVKTVEGVILNGF
jgi:hypothetical protein